MVFLLSWLFCGFAHRFWWDISSSPHEISSSEVETHYSSRHGALFLALLVQLPIRNSMPGKKFTQREAAKYLARCQNEVEIEEVSSLCWRPPPPNFLDIDADGPDPAMDCRACVFVYKHFVPLYPQVLSCYLYSKASRGHQSPMLARKLQLLGLYCCAM